MTTGPVPRSVQQQMPQAFNLPLQWVLSVLFTVQMYAAMALLALYFTPLALIDRRWATRGVRTYCRWVRWSAVAMLGLRSEIRGPVPQAECLIASKHQSFLDIILICSAVPRPKFIMKKQLKWTPILGWYALRMGCVPVDRGRRGQAIQQMLADVAKGAALPGQLVIYPQGTRVAPGAHLPYKVGTGVLFRELGQPCVPAATNVGVFWPRRGVLRKPGLAVLEFLAPIPAGQDTPAFMADLERIVETASDDLMAEAGFMVPPTIFPPDGSLPTGGPPTGGPPTGGPPTNFPPTVRDVP